MTRYTVADILTLHPCEAYDEDRVRQLWGRRRALTLPQILRLKISAEDRLWAAWRLLTTEQSQRAIELIVTRAVLSHAVACGVAKVEEWAINWLSGEDRSRASAYAAAVAYADAAYAAAIAYADAAYVAAAAAAAAYAYAAYAAVYAAAYAYQERELQVADILTVLEGWPA